MAGRPPGSIARIQKHDLAKLRALFADRLGARKPHDVNAHHVDRLFAELLGEPLPRRSALMKNGHANGNGNGNGHRHAPELAALMHRLRALDGEQLEAAVNAVLLTMTRLFDTPGHSARREKRLKQTP